MNKEILVHCGSQDRALCTVCNKSFSVCHQGNRDVERHMDSITYKCNSREVIQLPKTTSLFLPQNESIHENGISAEVKFIGFAQEHNLPLDVGERVGPLFRSMFPSRWSYNEDHSKQ